MPFVPVVGFWSTDQSISMDELLSAAAGRSAKYPRVVAVADDIPPLAEAMDVSAVEPVSLDELHAAVKDGALGILRITDVTPRVHALAIGNVSLFGNNRLTDVADWPLSANVTSESQWNQGLSWTWVAAGDVMMDRGVALAVKNHGQGGDYLFDGGTAKVTGTKCCSYFGYPYPTTQRTGNQGALRDLFSGADMSSANLESAVLVNAPYHAAGFTFTADAMLLDAVDAAGLDFMSIANNHIRNAGATGILTAIEQLDLRGIAHSGSGRGDASGNPGYIDLANGIRVAIISCDAIVPSWTATENKVGTFNCKKSDVAGRVREVRPTADVVIVFPHWGHEYHPEPVSYQRNLAADWIAAGADIVAGAHPHVAGAMDDIDGHLVFYSLGNFVFDQDFRTSTMMSVVPEMTWNGNHLVQVTLHSDLIIDSQPNLVSAADGGQFVFDQMRAASQGLLDY